MMNIMLTHLRPHKRGFTLIETLIAITLLLLAVVEPMVLTLQALKSAYYARDQITASHLAQDAIESVRAIRDGQILKIATGQDTSADLFGSIPVDQDFIINTTSVTPTITACVGACPPLRTDGTLYGYTAGWSETTFVRTVRMSYLPGTTDEVRLVVTMTWRTGSYPPRSIEVHEHLFRWVNSI